MASLVGCVPAEVQDLLQFCWAGLGSEPEPQLTGHSPPVRSGASPSESLLTDSDPSPPHCAVNTWEDVRTRASRCRVDVHDDVCACVCSRTGIRPDSDRRSTFDAGLWSSLAGCVILNELLIYSTHFP